MKKSNIWDSTLEKIYKIQSIISVILLIFLTFLIAVQVVLRYVFKTPLLGIEELLLFPVIWLYMLGGANASAEGTHIECGLCEEFIKNELVLQILKVLKHLLAIVINIVLMYWSYGFFKYSFKVWKHSGILDIPMFYGESAIFIGLLLMAIFGIKYLYGDTSKLIKMKNKFAGRLNR